jgi:hypothetical protein
MKCLTNDDIISILHQNFAELKAEYEEFKISVIEEQQTHLEFTQKKYIQKLESLIENYKEKSELNEKRLDWILNQDWFETKASLELEVELTNNNLEYKFNVMYDIDNQIKGI